MVPTFVFNGNAWTASITVPLFYGQCSMENQTKQMAILFTFIIYIFQCILLKSKFGFVSKTAAIFTRSSSIVLLYVGLWVHALRSIVVPEMLNIDWTKKYILCFWGLCQVLLIICPLGISTNRNDPFWCNEGEAGAYIFGYFRAGVAK